MRAIGLAVLITGATLTASEAVAAAAAAVPGKAILRAPTGKWVIDYARPIARITCLPSLYPRVSRRAAQRQHVARMTESQMGGPDSRPNVWRRTVSSGRRIERTSGARHAFSPCAAIRCHA